MLTGQQGLGLAVVLEVNMLPCEPLIKFPVWRKEGGKFQQEKAEAPTKVEEQALKKHRSPVPPRANQNWGMKGSEKAGH